MSSTPETRSEAYAQAPTRQVRQSRARVRYALTRYAVGRENATSGKALADRVPLKPTTVRDIIAELRDDPQGPPVGQCSQGYYILNSREELDEWVEGVKEEIATKRERLQANVESYNRRNVGGDSSW